MAYCTASDVQKLVKGYLDFSTSTVVPTATVTGWCDQKSAIADAALRRAGYTDVPATGENDLLELLDRVAAAVALQALYVGLGADNVPQSSIEMLSGWREWIKDLAAGKVWLPDQTPTRRRIRAIQGRRLTGLAEFEESQREE